MLQGQVLKSVTLTYVSVWYLETCEVAEQWSSVANWIGSLCFIVSIQPFYLHRFVKCRAAFRHGLFDDPRLSSEQCLESPDTNAFNIKRIIGHRLRKLSYHKTVWQKQPHDCAVLLDSWSLCRTVSVATLVATVSRLQLGSYVKRALRCQCFQETGQNWVSKIKASHTVSRYVVIPGVAW